MGIQVFTNVSACIQEPFNHVHDSRTANCVHMQGPFETVSMARTPVAQLGPLNRVHTDRRLVNTRTAVNIIQTNMQDFP